MLAYQIMILRRRAGMSQLQLAEKLHIGPSAVGMYEQGRRTPSVDLLIDMANLFGVSLDYLITGKESSNSIADKRGEAMQPPLPLKACCCCCCRYILTLETHCVDYNR